ncbi:PASTA domain-containing protein [Blattabacterium cuenoti]|uniref:PASTA domain-containing protein n=1 Tax=Blattabacterium cuenoti TaxID=1653831 RepID=UPI00163BA241|nr:PASTA domain-containing protein [Blattabacterium cuenoti]
MNYSKYFAIFIINLLISIFFLYKITKIALKWSDIYTKHGSYVVVPNLRYLTLSQSISILKKLGLKYDIDTSRYNPSFRNNQVISFSPEAGDHVKEGRHIYLQVNFSKYKQHITVLPNIINKSKYFAMKLLHANHIPVKNIRYIDDITKGTVLKVFYKKQSIHSGYIFSSKHQDGVTLIIGKGYEKNNSVVPNVIGMTLHSANSILKEKLFSVINSYYDHTIKNSDKDKNAKVYRQNPFPGEIQDKNKLIELWLTSKKPEEKKPEEKKPGEKKPGEKKPGEKKPGEKKPEEKKPEEKKPEEKKPEEKKPEEKKPEEKKPEEKKPEIKNQDIKNQERKNQERKNQKRKIIKFMK